MNNAYSRGICSKVGKQPPTGFTPCSRRLTRQESYRGEVVPRAGSPCAAGARLANGETRRSRVPGATFAIAVSMKSRREDEAVGHDVAELAALADGTLEPERRAALEARVAASPELAGMLAEQERAIALARSAAAEVDAPTALRTRIDAQRVGRGSTSRRIVLAGVGAAAVAVLAFALGLAVFDSETSGERFHAALGATDLVPDASGEATFTRTSSWWCRA